MVYGVDLMFFQIIAQQKPTIRGALSAYSEPHLDRRYIKQFLRYAQRCWKSVVELGWRGLVWATLCRTRLLYSALECFECRNESAFHSNTSWKKVSG